MILEFPKEAFTQQRLNDLFKQNMTNQQMFEELHRLVHQTQSIEALILWATLGCEVGEYDEIIDTLEQYLPDIAEKTYDEQLDIAYIQSLIGTWQLDIAQKVIDTKQQFYEYNHLNGTTLNALQFELDQQLQALHREELEAIDSLHNDIAQLDSLSYVMQQQLLPRLNLLTHDDYIKAAKQLLSSQSFHPLLKAYVLDNLILKGYKQETLMCFYGEDKKISCETCMPMDECQWLSEFEDILSNYQLNQHDYTVLVQNGRMYLALAFPFEKELFTSVENFVALLVQKHIYADHSNSWLNKFEQAIAEMII